MAQFVKLPGFVEHLAHGVHNFKSSGGHQLKIALSNTAPGAETTPPNDASDASKCVLANVTEVTYSLGATDRNLTISGSTQASGTYKLTIADATLTATGNTGPFRYIYVYNDTPTSPADPLIGYYDYGASITLQTADSFTVDFDASNGVLTLN